MKHVNLLAEDRRMMKHLFRNYKNNDYCEIVKKARQNERIGTTAKLENRRKYRAINVKTGSKKVKFLDVGDIVL